MIDIEEFAERFHQIARDVLEIRPHHRLRPHVFTEDKSEIGRRIREFATELKQAGRLPTRTATRFETGTIAGPTGRLVRVELRARRAA